MAARDYEICCAMSNAYLAKLLKKEKWVMSNDRRIISNSEIINLLDWFADKNTTENNPVLRLYSKIRENKAIEIRYIDAENTED